MNSEVDCCSFSSDFFLQDFDSVHCSVPSDSIPDTLQPTSELRRRLAKGLRDDIVVTYETASDTCAKWAGIHERAMWYTDTGSGVICYRHAKKHPDLYEQKAISEVQGWHFRNPWVIAGDGSLPPDAYRIPGT